MPVKKHARSSLKGGGGFPCRALMIRAVLNISVLCRAKIFVNLVVNTLSSRRLDAKRHYVIGAKALDGIWPVVHACAVLC